MTEPIRCIALFLVIGLCLSQFLIVGIADSNTSSTSIKVDIRANGDAVWVTEKRIPLNTLEDIEAWDYSTSNGTDRYRIDFEVKMKDYVGKISRYLDRPMNVENVNVTVEKSQPYTVIGNYSVTYGVLRYEFVWTGFATVKGDVIEVGDVFIDGFMLNPEDTMRIVLPDGYKVTSTSPEYDELKDSYQQQIVWRADSGNSMSPALRIFSPGEPSIILEKQKPDTGIISWGTMMVVIPVALISAIFGFGMALIIKRRESKKDNPVYNPVDTEDDAQVEVEDVPGDTGAGEVPHEAPDNERFMSDEERIIKYLNEAGGQMFQSDLVKRTAFSKSKLSMVLSDLKEKGMIVKIKKGKENLIRLNRQLAIQNNEEENNDTQV